MRLPLSGVTVLSLEQAIAALLGAAIEAAAKHL